MKVKSFSLAEPLPKLKNTQAIAVLEPWINVNNVGDMILAELIEWSGAKKLGELTRPGEFYDFTRYRPTLYFKKDIREIEIPNTEIYFARQKEGNDFLLLRLLEPQNRGEEYVESILELLKIFKVKRYSLFGSMYAPVPHTRPLVVSGGASTEHGKEILKKMRVQISNYEGPTSITFLINQLGPINLGIETMYFVVSLPEYIQLKRDFVAKIRLMEFLSFLYKVPIPDEDKKKTEQQLVEIERLVKTGIGIEGVVHELERIYDMQEGGKRVPLPPDVEKMLRDIERKGFSQS